MPEAVISDDVLRLLREELHGYAALETLILLSSQPNHTWRASQIAAELKIVEAEVEQALRELMSCGMASEHALRGSFAYQTGNEARERAVKELRRAYEENRMELVRIMSRNAIERVRSSAARAFADAFVLGKKKNDG
jgi:hypothetical protein